MSDQKFPLKSTRHTAYREVEISFAELGVMPHNRGVVTRSFSSRETLTPSIDLSKLDVPCLDGVKSIAKSPNSA